MRQRRLDLWIFGAVEGELELLVGELGARAQGEVGGRGWFSAQVRGMRVGLGVTGVGVASAAFSLGAFLGLYPASRAIMVGTCGALPLSGLRVGDIVLASSELLSELGVLKRAGIGDAGPLSSLGLEQEIPFSGNMLATLLNACRQVGSTHLGRLLTVAGVCATMGQARVRGRGFRALAENMEGYALALAGSRMGLDVAEVRCVSNRAGQRDRALWDLRGAQDRAQKAVLAYLRGGRA